MKFSLGKKMVLLIIVFAAILSGVSIAISFNVINSLNTRHYESQADETAAVVARVVDAQSVAKLKDEVLRIYQSTDDHVTSDADWESPEFQNYVAHYAHLEKTPEFKKVHAELTNLQEVCDVDCLYIAVVVGEDKVFVYLVDAAEEDACPTGCIDPLYEVNYRVIDDPAIGFPAYVTNTGYGWLVSAGAPIYDDNGEVVSYAFADYSMDLIRQQENDYLYVLSGALLALTVVLCVLVAFVVRRFITRPLNILSKAASRYCAPEGTERSTFANLDIRTHDEIEELHKSIIQMEHDIDSYIDNLVATRAQLKDTRREADKMNALAHKDALTGLRNKLAYDQEFAVLEHELKMGETAFGLAIVDLNDLKVVNDTYGHECGNVSLTKVSLVICNVFAHSPVFRIGGDEFVVVLRNGDYDKAEALVAEFQQTLAGLQADEALEPWERISAAIGYALFDPKQDADVESVFRRADKEMYMNKKQLKGEGAVR